MARTYLSGDNSRGNETTAMGGSYAHFRGWDAGVKVTLASDKGQPDRFAVWMTGGSNGSAGTKLVGYVTDTPDGPLWTPVDEPPHPRCGDLAPHGPHTWSVLVGSRRIGTTTCEGVEL